MQCDLYGGWRRGSNDLPEIRLQGIITITNLGGEGVNDGVAVVSVNGFTHPNDYVTGISFQHSKTFFWISDDYYQYDRVYTVRVEVNGTGELSGVTDTCSASYSIKTTFPRDPGNTDENILKLYITPNQSDVQAIASYLLSTKHLFETDIDRITRYFNEIGMHYESDLDTTGRLEFWRFTHETLSLAYGDCEDYAIAMCTLARAMNFSPEDIYVCLGYKYENGVLVGHAYIKLRDAFGWHYIEPQESGWHWFDQLSLDEYNVTVLFNDVYYQILA